MKEILCFGDSNTYGLIPGTKNRYGRDTRWTGLIEQQLYGKGCRIIEEGLCGRTTVFEDELREGRKGAADSFGEPCAGGSRCFNAWNE